MTRTDNHKFKIKKKEQEETESTEQFRRFRAVASEIQF
jgi:hypothetical protein